MTNKRKIIICNIIIVVAFLVMCFSAVSLMFPGLLKPKTYICDISDAKYVGTLEVPSVGVTIDTYGTNRDDGISQAICDTIDAAYCTIMKNRIIIGDHNYQQFNSIKKIKMGESAFLNGKAYICTGIVRDGKNEDGFATVDGVHFSKLDCDLILYTCNMTPKNITVVLFDEQK